MSNPDDFDDYYDDIEDDEDDLLEQECGRMSDGTCLLAGTEWCDWDCPLSGMRARQRIKAALSKAEPSP